MKSGKQLLNALTAFLGIIGICTATLVFFIVGYVMTGHSWNNNAIYIEKTDFEVRGDKNESSKFNEESMQDKQNFDDIISPSMNLSKDTYEGNEIAENLNTKTENIETVNESIIQEGSSLFSGENITSSEDAQADIYYEGTVDSIQPLNTENISESINDSISSEDAQADIYYEGTVDSIQSSNTESTSESINDNNSGGGYGNANNFNLYYDPEKNNTDAKYVLNTSSKLIHSHDCKDVRKIKDENYQTYNEDLSPLFASGYRYCKHCLDKR